MGEPITWRGILQPRESALRSTLFTLHMQTTEHEQAPLNHRGRPLNPKQASVKQKEMSIKEEQMPLRPRSGPLGQDKSEDKIKREQE